MDSSRAVISASTRVRRNSSGFHRWVLAVTSSSGARRRIAASFSRRSPSFRSAASGGGAVLTTAAARDRVVGQRPDRHRRQLEHQRLPGGAGLGCGAGGGQDRAHVGGAPPANATARSSAASSASSPWAACRVRISASSLARLVTPAAAAPVRNASADRPRARNSFSAAVFGAAPGAAAGPGRRRSAHRRCWSHPARPGHARRRPRR